MNSVKYSYKIFYDLDLDVWNWVDGSHIKSHGKAWRDNLRDENDKALFDLVAKMAPKDAEKYLYKELPLRYKSNVEYYNKRQQRIDEVFSAKFDKACNKLIEITGKHLYYQDYTIKLTTFPKGPYNFDEGFFGYYYDNPNPLAKTFMHEVLHFQFIAYWGNNPKSSVSKLSQEQFHFLNESLTVVLDDDLRSIIGSADQGYDLHKPFREILHEHWAKYHDFDKLVDFGLDDLEKFI